MPESMRERRVGQVPDANITGFVDQVVFVTTVLLGFWTLNYHRLCFHNEHGCTPIKPFMRRADCSYWLQFVGPLSRFKDVIEQI